jgi:hypothetical protein
VTHRPGRLALSAGAACLGLAAPAVAQLELDLPQKPPTSQRPADAGEPKSAQNNALEGEITPALDAAVAKGIAFLVSQQDGEGAFGDGRYGKNVAVAALAGIALMADGNLPGRGAQGDKVAKCVDYILANCSESGLIAGDSANGPMYGHGFATLFLGEVYGMTAGGGDTTQGAKVHEALVKAVRLIEQTQNEQGGWRYNPIPYDADISVTICQIMALRSARNAGIEVSKQTIDRAVDYVRRCQNPDGGFKYQLEQGASGWPRSAAGVASLYYAGIYQDQAIDKGVAYLQKEAMPGQLAASKAHYFYGHYYAVQAMYLAGGDAWARWWPAIRQELISSQQENGSWEDRSVGECYGTAMALIILQMPKRYLPIFQK